jgi:endoglucanase
MEGRVVAYVERFVRERRRLRLRRDEHGNVLIVLPGRSKGPARWVFTAHMDHPGMVTRGMIDENTVEAEFRGFVLAKYVKGTKVRFFDGQREITGKVVKAKADKRGLRTSAVRARVGRAVGPNVIGMLDQGEGRVKGGRFYSRAIDDLGGAAAGLAMLDKLHRNPPAATVAVLLTRAEEEGLIGAIAAAKRPKLLKKSDRLIAVECSAVQPYAPQGTGPIIRVGDKTSVFDSSLTYFLTQQAEALRKKNRSFRYQRALMPGGTCEATVYDAYGFRAAGVCVAMGNYHNMNRGRKRIGPEHIDVNDWKNMVNLFVAIARAGHQYRAGHKALRQRIEKRFARRGHLLRGVQAGS